MTDLLRIETKNAVTTVTFCNPKKLNGWTLPMMLGLQEAMSKAATSPETQAVILTGTDPYYSAGVNLSGTIKLAHPQRLHDQIREHNQSLFDGFIDFPKPMVAAVNGPAIGATVTSATLCDALIASDKATFSTPFAALGVPPEGCSSVLFARLMGEENARRMLGAEGWKPSGQEAADVGLATEVVPHAELLVRAQALCESWVEAGKTRSYRGEADPAELRAINALESRNVATAFLGKPFLRGQYRFLRRKKKRGPAALFYGLMRTRRLWSKLLDEDARG